MFQKLTDYHTLALVHSDLWGPSPIISRNGCLYYVSFVDHFNRFTWIYLLKRKSDVADVFKQFKVMAENQFSTKLKLFQSDWGEGEENSKHYLLFFKECGIVHIVSCPHTPQLNGLAERKHRHIVETSLALLSQDSLPHKFWDDAFITAVYLINLMPTKVINNFSPFEKLYSTKPDYTTLKVFGCLCYPFLRPYNKHKLNYISDRAVFLGYSPSHKGYKALLPGGKVIVTRDIVFDEHCFPFQSHISDISNSAVNKNSVDRVDSSLNHFPTPPIIIDNSSQTHTPDPLPHNAHNIASSSSPSNSTCSTNSSSSLAQIHDSASPDISTSNNSDHDHMPPISSPHDDDSQTPRPTHHMTTRSFQA